MRTNQRELEKCCHRFDVRHVVLLSVITSISFLIAGCGKMNMSIKSLAPKPPDFLNTEMINNGPAMADGLSDLIVVIHLKNSNNSPVSAYRPTFDVVPSTGVTPMACTASDSNGMSICLLRATAAGPKRLRLTNARVGLEHEVMFEPPKPRKPTMELVSGSSQNATTAAGHKVQVSVGTSFKGLKATTTDGYKMDVSVQGLSTSH